jgi:TRAP-type transport system small permease protein
MADNVTADHDVTDTGTRGFSPLGWVENVAAGVVLVAMVVVVLMQVAYRYLMHAPLSWSSEVTTGLLVWSAFIGLAIAAREDAHVALRLWEHLLSPRRRYAVRLGQLVLFAFVLGALVFGGVALVIGEWGITSPIGIPRWTLYSAVPVGAGLSLVHVVARAFRLRPEPAAASAAPADSEVDSEATVVSGATASGEG